MTMQAERRPAAQEEYQEQGTDPTFLALQQKSLRVVTEYLPFGAKEKIILTPERVIQYFCKPTKSGVVCTIEQAQKFIMLCKSRELDPWQGDAFIVGYDAKDGPEFNLITAHQAFLKRADAHEMFEGMESGVIAFHADTDSLKELEGDFVPADCQLVGGWARVHRKDRKIQMYRRAALTAFQKPFGVWINNPAGMICKCAEADALRSAFPNNLGGLYMSDELSPLEVSSPKPATSRLASMERSRALAEIGAADPQAEHGLARRPILADATQSTGTAKGEGATAKLESAPSSPRGQAAPVRSSGRPGPKNAVSEPAGQFTKEVEAVGKASMPVAEARKAVAAAEADPANAGESEAPGEPSEEEQMRIRGEELAAANNQGQDAAPEQSEDELRKLTASKAVDVAVAKGLKSVERILNSLAPSLLIAAKANAGLVGSIAGRKIEELAAVLYEAKMIELSNRE